MMHNERGPATTNIPPVAERVGKVQEKKTEKSIIERMSATVLDIGRDILTANEMAMDNFDRKSPLLVAAQGGATVLVGIGLEKVLDETFKKGMKGGTLYFGKLQVDIPDKIAKQIKDFEKTNPRLHHFILQSTKDLLTGTIYNGLTFFARPMFESAKSEHLVGSLAINATEAMFTRGLDYDLKLTGVQDARELVRHQDDVQVQSLREVARNMAVPELGDVRMHELKEKRSTAIKERLKLDAEKKKLIDPTNKPLEWQTFLRQYSTFSNPATLLGLDMMGRSMIALKDNFVEVRRVRKEKGLEGKRVEMSKSGDWRNRGSSNEYRGKYENKGKWQGNKDKVYYGKSNWKNADQKAQEEYELKAGS